MPRTELCLVFLLGALAAGVVGAVSQRVRWSRNRVRAFFEPQNITLSTDRTPFQVLEGCLEGMWGLVLLGLLIAVVLFLVWFFS